VHLLSTCDCHEDDQSLGHVYSANIDQFGRPREAGWGTNQNMKSERYFGLTRFLGSFHPRLFIIRLEFLAKTGRLERLFTGSTIKHFTRESFLSLPIPFPPLAEQTRIVAEIERRLSAVEELEAVVSANFQRAAR
jgi:type I restriction enzyme S subunit